MGKKMKYHDIFYKLTLAKRMHHKVCDKIIDQEGLHYGQLPVLDYMNENDCTNQREMAEKLHVSAPSMTNTVKRMVKNGFISCEVKDGDRRSHQLQITDKGKEARIRCISRFDQLDCAVMDGVSKEDIIVFDAVLTHIVERLKEIEKEEFDD